MAYPSWSEYRRNYMNLREKEKYSYMQQVISGVVNIFNVYILGGRWKALRNYGLMMTYWVGDEKL